LKARTSRRGCARSGAIERVQLGDGDVHLHTIGQQPPVGICGSGILDAIAEMLEAGLLSSRGMLNKDHPRVRVRDNKTEFVLAPSAVSGHGRDVTITRSDVNEIQLAKSAIRAGIDILLADCGIDGGAIDEFIVAGAFGTYLDLNSAIRIGMFPDLPRGRFQQVGNAAGTGARQMLVSAQRRQLARTSHDAIATSSSRLTPISHSATSPPSISRECASREQSKLPAVIARVSVVTPHPSRPPRRGLLPSHF